MATLTWRNVGTPDFSSSMQGYRTFSNLLGNAFGGLERGLDRYDATLDQRANNRLLMEFAGMQDADAAQAALASLGSREDAGRINAATIGAVTGRPMDLLRQDAERGNLDWTNYTRNRTKGFNTAEDANAPLINEYLTTRGTDRAAAFDAANPNFGRGLSFERMAGLTSDAQRYRSGEVDITGGMINNTNNRQSGEQSRTRFGWDVQDRNDMRAIQNAQGILESRGFNGGNITEDALQSLGLNSRQTSMLRRSMGAFGPSGGGGAGSSGPIGDGGNYARIINGAAGGGYVPDNVQTLGQAVQFGKGLNNRGAASSAMGLYQITQSTLQEFAPKALGADWQNQPFNAESQDKVAEQIFNWAKGQRNPAAALKGRWVSLSESEAARLVQGDWGNARGIIAQKESGISPQALMAQGTVAQQGAARQFMERNAGDIAVRANETYGNTSSISDVTANLKKNRFPGVSQGALNGQINQIIAEGRRQNVNLSPAMAAAIMEESVGQTGWFDRALNSTPLGYLGVGADTLGDGQSLDMNAVKSRVSQLASGGTARTAVANQMDAAMSGQVNQARQALAQAEARASQVAAQAQGNRRLDPSIIARVNQDVMAARQNLYLLQGAQGEAIMAADAANGRNSFGGGNTQVPVAVAPAPRPTPSPRANQAPSRQAPQSDPNNVSARRDAQTRAMMARRASIWAEYTGAVPNYLRR